MPLLGYIILYKKSNGHFRVESMKSVLPTPLEAVVEDLEKFTDYIIRIYAFTSNGNGTPSQAVAVKTQEDGKLLAKSPGYEHVFMHICCHWFF